jgi:hypothetical protein
MSNNKQQMTVEMMWNEIDNLFPFKDSVEAQKFCAILDKYKQMEKEKAIKLHYEYELYVMMNESVVMTFGQFYKQTYGGGEQ